VRWIQIDMCELVFYFLILNMVYNMFLATHNNEFFCKKWWLYS